MLCKNHYRAKGADRPVGHSARTGGSRVKMLALLYSVGSSTLEPFSPAVRICGGKSCLFLIRRPYCPHASRIAAVAAETIEKWPTSAKRDTSTRLVGCSKNLRKKGISHARIVPVDQTHPGGSRGFIYLPA